MSSKEHQFEYQKRSSSSDDCKGQHRKMGESTFRNDEKATTYYFAKDTRPKSFPRLAKIRPWQALLRKSYKWRCTTNGTWWRPDRVLRRAGNRTNSSWRRKVQISLPAKSDRRSKLCDRPDSNFERELPRQRGKSLLCWKLLNRLVRASKLASYRCSSLANHELCDHLVAKNWRFSPSFNFTAGANISSERIICSYFCSIASDQYYLQRDERRCYKRE